jgi:hypothetical protein
MINAAIAEKRLRLAFAVGAVADALALLPMFSPRVSGLVFGGGQNPFNSPIAMGCSASLMLGWTLLLLWAYERPMERRFVAALTIVVVAGLALTGALAVMAGASPVSRIAPIWLLQGLLIWLFARAYWSSRVTRSNRETGMADGLRSKQGADRGNN